MSEKMLASWAHGVTAIAENVPGSPRITVQRHAFGSTFKIPPNTNNGWILMPIPTPVVVEDDRATLLRVLVFFDAQDDCRLEKIRVFDGSAQVGQKDRKLHGEYLSFSRDNTFDIDPIDIISGIVVSANFVNRGPEAGNVFVQSFGGDFKHNVNVP